MNPADRVRSQKRLEFIHRNYEGRVRDDFTRGLRDYRSLDGEGWLDPPARISVLLFSYARGDDQYFRRVIVGLLATDNHCDGTIYQHLPSGWLHFQLEDQAVVAMCGGCSRVHDVAQAIVEYLGLVFVRFDGDRVIEMAQFAHVLGARMSFEIAIAIGEYFALRKEMGLPPLGLE